jgi:hypothetical protein
VVRSVDIEHACLHVICEILFVREQLQRVAAMENFEVKFMQSNVYKVCMFSS